MSFHPNFARHQWKVSMRGMVLRRLIVTTFAVALPAVATGERAQAACELVDGRCEPAGFWKTATKKWKTCVKRGKKCKEDDAFGPEMEIGGKGEIVRNLQEQLKKQGYNVSADGQFGVATEKAVKDLQAKGQIKSDGKVGPQTLELLK
jgi:murein L,D-transpeptidase YcbB/YkuD